MIHVKQCVNAVNSAAPLLVAFLLLAAAVALFLGVVPGIGAPAI